MTRATIQTCRKYIYFYAVVLLTTVAFAILKPAESGKPDKKVRAAEVNRLASTLFQ